MSLKRLAKEIDILKTKGSKSFEAGPDDGGNLYVWTANIFGPVAAISRESRLGRLTKGECSTYR